MRVWFQRHAEAVKVPELAGKGLKDMTPEEKQLDASRPLTALGKQQARAVALQMSMRGDRPNTIVCSPYLRCMQTASIMGETLGAPVLMTSALEPHRDVADWLRDVAKGNNGVDRHRLHVVAHHDNLVPALAELGNYTEDDVKPLPVASVRALKLSKIDKKNSRWEELGRYVPADDGDDDMVTAAAPTVASVSPLRTGPQLTASAKK